MQNVIKTAPDFCNDTFVEGLIAHSSPLYCYNDWVAICLPEQLYLLYKACFKAGKSDALLHIASYKAPFC